MLPLLYLCKAGRISPAGFRHFSNRLCRILFIFKHVNEMTDMKKKERSTERKLVWIKIGKQRTGLIVLSVKGIEPLESWQLTGSLTEGGTDGQAGKEIEEKQTSHHWCSIGEEECVHVGTGVKRIETRTWKSLLTYYYDYIFSPFSSLFSISEWLEEFCSWHDSNYFSNLVPNGPEKKRCWENLGIRLTYLNGLKIRTVPF